MTKDIKDGWTIEASVDSEIAGPISFKMRCPTGSDLAELYKTEMQDDVIYPTKRACQFMTKHLVSWSLTDEITVNLVCSQNMVDLSAVLAFMINPMNHQRDEGN